MNVQTEFAWSLKSEIMRMTPIWYVGFYDVREIIKILMPAYILNQTEPDIFNLNKFLFLNPINGVF